jgi:hypothetical protein
MGISGDKGQIRVGAAENVGSSASSLLQFDRDLGGDLCDLALRKGAATLLKLPDDGAKAGCDRHKRPTCKGGVSDVS